MPAARPGPADRTPIPLSVLTGFLGAGKTTLLNRLVADEGMADTALIINEFGEVGIDHLLVETANEDIVEMSSGCLCCTISGDLIRTLEDLVARRDAGEIRHFSRVVIETTGLADPAPVLHTIMNHNYLVYRYRLASVVTVVDAVNGMATLDAHAEAVKQAAMADRLVLTKTDLLDEGGPDGLDVLKARLRELNPAAPILDAARGEAVAARLFDAGLYDPEAKSPDVVRWLAAEAYDGDGRHDHGHGHEHDHDHDPNRHDEHIRAFCITTDQPIKATSLELFMELLRLQHGNGLLRLKGIVLLEEEPERPVVIHAVQHVFHPPVRLGQWPGDGERLTRLVCITRDVEKSQIEGLLEAFTDRLTDGGAAFRDMTLSLRPGGGR